MIRKHLFRRKSQTGPADGLYLAIVEQARRPAFYRDHGVPDTLDGRFEMIALHVFLVLHRLKADQGETESLAQSLFDVMFLDMDQSLRELGAGDLGVGPRVKRMARGLYGRIAAYEDGLDGSDEQLQGALQRNLYGTVDPDQRSLAAMVAYVRREAAALAGRELAALSTGTLDFGAPPEPTPGA